MEGCNGARLAIPVLQHQGRLIHYDPRQRGNLRLKARLDVQEPESTRPACKRAWCVRSARGIRRKGNGNRRLREVASKAHAAILAGPAELPGRPSVEAPDSAERTRRNYSGLILCGALELLARVMPLPPRCKRVPTNWVHHSAKSSISNIIRGM